MKKKYERNIHLFSSGEGFTQKEELVSVWVKRKADRKG